MYGKGFVFLSTDIVFILRPNILFNIIVLRVFKQKMY